MANQLKNDHNDHKSLNENTKHAKNGLHKNAESQSQHEYGKQAGSHHGQSKHAHDTKENKSSHKEHDSKDYKKNNW